MTETCKGTSSSTELKLHNTYADLKELKPVSGFAKGQAAPVVQSPKALAPLTLANKSAVNTESESPQQPLQQVQQSAAVEYEKNSLAIKLANNPLSSLAGLHEAVGTVLDEPVSSTAFFCQHNLPVCSSVNISMLLSQSHLLHSLDPAQLPYHYQMPCKALFTFCMVFRLSCDG